MCALRLGMGEALRRHLDREDLVVAEEGPRQTRGARLRGLIPESGRGSGGRRAPDV